MASYTRSVKVEWRGLNKLRHMLEPNGMKHALISGLDDAAIFVEGRAKQYVPVKTSRLQHDIRVSGLGMGPTRLIVSGSDKVRYASAVHEGSGLYGPHAAKYPIRPKTKKMLFFPSQGAMTARFGAGAKMQKRASGKVSNKTLAKYNSAGFVFSRLVMHPGVKGRPYLKRAMDELDFKKILAKAMIRRYRQARNR